MKAARGDEALRRFRFSQPNADYFITANLAEKSIGRWSPATRDAIRRELEAIQTDGHWRIRGAVIMPDHLHLLITLGDSLDLSRVMARLKARTGTALLRQGLRWQSNFYEHRLRPNEDEANVLLYLFLNPHRAGLIPASASYPWFWLGKVEQEWFEPGLDDGAPLAEWLR